MKRSVLQGDYTFAGLERTVIPALESVRVDTIRKYYRKSREYMQAYKGKTGESDVESEVQKNKSDHRVFE